MPRTKKADSTPSIQSPTAECGVATPPARVHDANYHYPLLLRDSDACDALLEWFATEEKTRSMPWRKKWIDPGDYKDRKDELGRDLSKRAYEVWVSEVMLQQTRVSTVIPYFNTWISKWPTVQQLAEAAHDDVLSVWKGLGYYSRATRLHDGAKAMIAKSDGASCVIPDGVKELQKFPGIGRYTAGAISSIVFGRPEPVLDGNVIRVLSRQLGLYMDPKDKKATDILWSQADEIIKHASKLSEDCTSSIPGQWNQALMELGSTVCTPKPSCENCPIQKTCRVYAEGQNFFTKQVSPIKMPDIEDGCTMCEPLDMEDLVSIQAEVVANDMKINTKRKKTSPKQSNTISNYFGAPVAKPKTEMSNVMKMEYMPAADINGKRKTYDAEEEATSAASYCALFPKKVAKKKAAEEECVVCMIEMRSEDGTSAWLIEQRPAKGLLASLWQFPQSTLEKGSNSTPTSRRAAARAYIFKLDVGDLDPSKATFVAEYPPLVHVFTHIRLTMHAYHYRITTDKPETPALRHKTTPVRRWIAAGAMDNETLSTGMRKCWNLIADAL